MGGFSVLNFGCRASQADGAAIEGQLTAAGWQPAGAGSAPALVVLNSCTVTSSADQDLEKAVRRLRREQPQARILITGCYAQRAPERMARLDGVTWVVGNSDKDRIAEIVGPPELTPMDRTTETSYHAQIHVRDMFLRREFFSAPVGDAPSGRARPNLKVQDGCNNRCSFCVIPAVRGASRSAPADWVIAQVRQLASRYAEVVLTGVNLGRWGREQGAGRQLTDLLRRILRETPVQRLRLSSIEPMDWTDDLIDLLAHEPRLARHVHAPLQSGSDAVLRRMYRKYRPRHYRDRLERAFARMPDAAFGADVMAGFPGETDQEFLETCDFVRALPFTYLHVFTYAERPGTAAAHRPDPVPVSVRKERTRILRAIGEEKNRQFRQRMIGQPLSVVTLGDREALSSNYIPVRLAAPCPAQQIRVIRPVALTPGGVAEATLLPVLV